MMKEKSKAITFEEVEQRLKNLKLEEYTAEDVFDRFIGYGNTDDFENVEVQKLLIKHNLVEHLIYSMGSVITDNEVIQEIMESNLFEDKSYMLKKGTIESLEIKEDKDLPNGMCWLIINFIDENGTEKYQIKYIYYDKKEQKYKSEISTYQGKSIMAIVKKDEQTEDLRLCCLLKNIV